MRDRSEIKTPLADAVRSQHEEIEKYRWIESEKVGRDIGWKRASEEWTRKHFPSWKRHARERGILPPLLEVLWSQQLEIESYKWIESEKRGHDIGWEQAVTEWNEQHYGQWSQHTLTTTLEELGTVRRLPSSESTASRHEKRKRAFSQQHREKIGSAMRAWHERRKRGL